jgi:hypothetical protein
MVLFVAAHRDCGRVLGESKFRAVFFFSFFGLLYVMALAQQHTSHGRAGSGTFYLPFAFLSIPKLFYSRIIFSYLYTSSASSTVIGRPPLAAPEAALLYFLRQPAFLPFPNAPSPPLLSLYFFNPYQVLGVLYSADLPWLRWKRHPFLAATCILAVRAIMVQLGFYSHMRVAVLGGTLAATPVLQFTVAFMTVSSIVIALFKDVPDIKGDRMVGFKTFSVR